MAGRPVHRSMFLSLSLLLSSCRPYAPSVYIAGSYFPAWLICFTIGALVSALLRVVFIRIGLDDVLPFKLLVYVCLALLVAMVIAYFGFAY